MKRLVCTVMVVLLCISCSTFSRTGVNVDASLGGIGKNEKVTDLEQLLVDIEKLGYGLTPAEITAGSKKTLAILTFDMSSPDSAMSTLVQEALYEHYFKKSRFILIERDKIEKILNEMSLQNSGIVDERTAAKIGKVLGADYICFGSINAWKDTLRIYGKIVKTENSEIVAISSINTININSDKASTKAQNLRMIAANWQVEIKRQDFESKTIYTFKTKSTQGESIVLGYVKALNPAQSYVRIGIMGTKNTWTPLVYDIKDDAGSIKAHELTAIAWRSEIGQIGYDGYNLMYCDIRKTRYFFNLLLANESLTIRIGDWVIRFYTNGLAGVIDNSGVTYKELDAAIKNEEY